MQLLGPCDSAALGSSPLVTSTRAHHIQTVPVNIQGDEWIGAVIFTRTMCARILCHYTCHSMLCSPWWSCGTMGKMMTWHVAFCVAGLAAWNSLPTDIRTASTLANFNPVNPVLPHTTPPAPLAHWFVVNFRQASGVLWPVLGPFRLYQYDCWWSVYRPCGYICAFQTGRFSSLQRSKG